MPDRLFLAYTEPGSVPEDEFHDWYDNEHLPARLAVPGFHSAARYRAADGAVPTWLAVYDIAPGTLDSAAYKDLYANNSDREKSVLKRLDTLRRREYELIGDERPAGAPDKSPEASPALLLVSMSVPPEGVDDMNAWYAEEHIPMLLAVPGWRRVRRYRQISGDGPEYLSFHDVDGHHVFDQEAYKAAITTPWRERILKTAIGRERRVFSLHKAF
ncbi:MAG: hypothetical protein FWE35_00100 [Streptosporangiales bacterium]|nr:hypothetical protein [Streptosporangiales bacterium]